MLDTLHGIVIIINNYYRASNSGSLYSSSGSVFYNLGWMEHISWSFDLSCFSAHTGNSDDDIIVQH